MIEFIIPIVWAMAFLIKAAPKVPEGQIINRWFLNRMVRRNQNVILAITGSTGSGKSYLCLRIAELWYKFFFKKGFDVAVHVCFSIGEVMKLLASGILKRGDIIILEEAGTSLGSLDFHNRVSKLFGYVLQSFRSLNVCLIMNLPVLSMLNKSARLLIHSHFVTAGIDYKTKKSTCKAYFRQINQQTGKIYDKFLRVKINGRTTTVKKFQYSMPSDDMVKVYEAQKLKFVTELNESFSRELEQIEKVHTLKMSRKTLTKPQQDIFDWLEDGYNVKQIAAKKGCALRSVYTIVHLIEKKGFTINIPKKPKEIPKMEGQSVI